MNNKLFRIVFVLVVAAAGFLAGRLYAPNGAGAPATVDLGLSSTSRIAS